MPHAGEVAGRFTLIQENCAPRSARLHIGHRVGSAWTFVRGFTAGASPEETFLLRMLKRSAAGVLEGWMEGLFGNCGSACGASCEIPCPVARLRRASVQQPTRYIRAVPTAPIQHAYRSSPCCSARDAPAVG